MTRRLLLVAVGIFLLVFVALPVGALAGGVAELGLALQEEEAILNTVLLAAGSAAVAVGFGLPVGWVAARRRLPPLLEGAVLLPYAVPPYVTTVAWIVLANPTNGLLSAVLPLDVYSLAGMVGVLGLHLSPLVVLAVRDALRRIDPALEEAARVSGAAPTQVFTRITLPLAAPGILAAAAFVASSAAASFGVPYLLSSSADRPIPVLTLRIFRSLELAPVAGRPLALALSLVLLALGVSLPALVRLFLGAGPLAGNRLARPRPAPPAGAWGGVVGFWLLLAVLIPVGTIAFTSLSPTFGRLEGLTLAHWSAVLAEDRTRSALLRSAGLAAAAATLAVAVGALVATVAERTPSRAVSLLAGLARAPWAIPGSVFALGMILVFSQEVRLIVADRVTFVLALANTPWILGLAYAAKSLAVPLDGVGAAARTLDRTLEEAARISGASWARTQRSIVVPLLVPALISGWVLVFAGSFCEVSMSVLLRGPGTEVLGTRLFELLSYGSPQQASVVAMIVVAVVLAGGPLLTGRSRWA